MWETQLRSLLEWENTGKVGQEDNREEVIAKISVAEVESDIVVVVRGRHGAYDSL